MLMATNAPVSDVVLDPLPNGTPSATNQPDFYLIVRVFGKIHVMRFVEVEVDTPEQYERTLALEPGLIDFVLLDNFSLEQLRAAVARRDETSSPIRLEASGGVTLDTVWDIARAGVDRISVGGLTHQAVSLDVGLDA